MPVPILFFKLSARKLSVIDALGEPSTFEKELAGPLVAFYSEWIFFFFSSNGHKIGKTFDQGHIFQVTYHLELFSSFYFGLSNTLP